MSLSGIGRANRVGKESVSESAALAVFVQGKEGDSPQLFEREARKTDMQFPASSHHEPTTDQCRTWLVKAKENVTLAPRCRQIVTGILETGKGQKGPPLVCVEPAQIPIEGILPAARCPVLSYKRAEQRHNHLVMRPEIRAVAFALCLRISAMES
jgi:hypothetical protein